MAVPGGGGGVQAIIYGMKFHGPDRTVTWSLGSHKTCAAITAVVHKLPFPSQERFCPSRDIVCLEALYLSHLVRDTRCLCGSAAPQGDHGLSPDGDTCRLTATKALKSPAASPPHSQLKKGFCGAPDWLSH